MLKGNVGTAGYRPMEMEEKMGEYKGLQADLFAAGFTLFVMKSGGIPPFSRAVSIDQRYRHFCQNNYTRFWKIFEKSYPKDYFPDSYKRLINSMFCVDPSKRSTVEELEEDEWLSGETATDKQISEYLDEKYQ